jgi:7-carboxy-7-deazaguanine synthase
MSLLLHLTEEKKPEIFETIQGEGVDMGLPAFFIRLQGCNVHCFFCDEKETWVKRENNSIGIQPEEILSKLEELNPLLKRVVITGGEPTEQNLKPLISLLVKNNYRVSIETAGTGEYLSVLFEDYTRPNSSNDQLTSYLSKFLNITFSPKEPYSKSSKIQDEKIWAQCDEVKFVVANEEALDYVINTIVGKLKNHGNFCPIFLVPDWYNFEKTKTLVLNLLREYPSYFRLGTQLHKIVEMP